MLCVALASFGVPADAEAWTTKKKYEEYLQSLPAEGPRPSMEYAQAAALEYFRLILKDAESARYEWGGIEQGVFRGGLERFGTPGWILSVSVNGKNSYGGYTGFSPYKLIFRSGFIVEVYGYHERSKTWIAYIGVKRRPIPPLPSYGEPQRADQEPAPEMNYRPSLPN